MVNTSGGTYKVQHPQFLILWELPLAAVLLLHEHPLPLLLLIRPEETPGPKVGPRFSLLGIENWDQEDSCQQPLLLSQAVEILGWPYSHIPP